jgi:transcriptional regulator with XRE-family HTH domain
MQPKSDFTKRLRALMAERGWSASDLAAAVWGRYTNTEGKYVARNRDRISVYSNGKSVPTGENLKKLAQAFGVPTSALMTEAELLERKPIPPDARIDSLSDGRAHLFINRVVSMDSALKIMALL